jgi:hypothetical protein
MVEQKENAKVALKVVPMVSKKAEPTAVSKVSKWVVKWAWQWVVTMAVLLVWRTDWRMAAMLVGQLAVPMV